MKRTILGVVCAFFLSHVLGGPAQAQYAMEDPPGPTEHPAACTAVDVRETLGPVRFQDDKAWCFAFVGADLLSYTFREELKGERVSAVYTALTYTRNYRVDPYSDAGGLARFAVRSAYKRGLCPQSLEEEALHRGPLGSLSDKLESLRTLKSLYDRKDMQGLDRELDELAKSNSIVTAVPRSKLMRVLKESSQRSFPIRFADLLCAGHRFRPTRKIKVKSVIKYVEGTPKIFRGIDEQLSAGNIVGIAYYSAFLLLGDDAPHTDKHLSVLVGRRWSASRNRCEYLIRNSFGPQCLGYAGDYRAPENCQEGHIWVPRSILEENVYAITYIEP